MRAVCLSVCLSVIGCDQPNAQGYNPHPPNQTNTNSSQQLEIERLTQQINQLLEDDSLYACKDKVEEVQDQIELVKKEIDKQPAAIAADANAAAVNAARTEHNTWANKLEKENKELHDLSVSLDACMTAYKERTGAGRLADTDEQEPASLKVECAVCLQ